MITAPYAVGSDTSAAAAASIAPVLKADEKRIHDFVASAGATGATCDEAERALDMSHQTCSARFNGLRKSGRLVETAQTRKTRSGRAAHVYVAKECAT